MRKFLKYDPEDIESLLLNKEFSQLYDEERLFVLKHIASEKAYDVLRKTLLNVTGVISQDEDDDLVPSAAIKSHLLEEVKRNAPVKSFWLNSIALFREIEARPVFRLTAAAIVMLAIGVFLVRDFYMMERDSSPPATTKKEPVQDEPVKLKTGTEPPKPQQAINDAPAKQPAPERKQHVIRKNSVKQDDVKSKNLPAQPMPAMASRSLAQDEALEAFLFEVM